MIQRKQTLYLLLSGALLIAMLFFPMVKVVLADMVYSFTASGFEDLSGDIVQPTWALFGVTILIVLISFVSIFLYTKRVLQMRVTIFNLILKIGFYVLAFLYYRNFVGVLAEMGVEPMLRFTPWLSLPLVAIVLDCLAYRGIAIDEQTIRFMDRLR